MPGEAVTGTPDQPAAPLSAPVQGERIGTLDFIRGIAVIGIVFANAAAFGQPFSAGFYPGAFLVPHSSLDDWGWLVQLVLIDGKMRGLFTVLFGAGLVLFMERAWTRGAGLGLQLRRLFWLLCFGIAHFVLLWRGDILMSYAVAGAVALLFVRWQGRQLITLGLVAYAMGALLMTLAYGLPAMMAEGAFAADPSLTEAGGQLAAAAEGELARERAEGEIIRSGAYPAFVQGNAAQLPAQFGFALVLSLLETVPLILIGMGLHRTGLFTGGFDRRRLLLWSVAGIVAGGVATGLLGLREMHEGLTYYGTLWAIAGASMVPRLPMILGFAGLFVLIAERVSGWLDERVQAAGRAAFSNYIGTSFVMLWVFHGFGLGLFGELGRMQLYGVACLAGALMLLWSKAWLDRFRYGPLEWIWRCLTYGRLFALRRRGENDA